ncbi:MAG: rhodanese-like domain-containing protein [Patescibacteria group bacterium]
MQKKKKREQTKIHKVADVVKISVKPKVKNQAMSFMIVLTASFVLTVFMINIAPNLFTKGKNHILFLQKTEVAKQKIKIVGNEQYEYIDPVLVKEYIEIQRPDMVLIDSRSREEYEVGHIKGAINIPLYMDFRRPYESMQEKQQWIKDIKKYSRYMNEIIVYGYRPDADLLLVSVEALRKERKGVKILSVGYGDWQGGYWSWMPGGELLGEFNINNYIERTDK